MAEENGGSDAVRHTQNTLCSMGVVHMVYRQMCQPWGDINPRVRDELVLTAIALLDGGNVDVQETCLHLMKASPDAFLGNIIVHIAEVTATVHALPTLKLEGGVSTVLAGGAPTQERSEHTFEAEVAAAYEAGLPEPQWESATNLFRLLQVRTPHAERSVVAPTLPSLLCLLPRRSWSRGTTCRYRTC